jgi:alkylation response protein AidB-like acyl-CoA dehydrogenase/mannose-6-phosphate isomerase-like protein (cupin superfamily)
MQEKSERARHAVMAVETPSLRGPVPAGDTDHAPAKEAAGYQRVRIHRDDDLEVTAARWEAGGHSSLHGHGDSAAAYAVVSGSIEEERYLPHLGGYRYEKVVLKAGERTYLPPGSFHRVRALEESVTLHRYSPAPATTTSDVPPAVRRQLDEARRRHTRSAGTSRHPALWRPRPDVVAVVDDLLDGWAERETRANRDGLLRLPPATVADMRDSGILAAPLPPEHGGWGASLHETAQVLRRVARRAPSTALALVMPLGNAATTLIPDEVIPAALRPALAEGKAWIADRVRRGRILAVANSEPGAGGDLANTKTVARRGPDGVYRLSGRKSFATFGRDADYFLCAARRCDGGPDDDRVVDGFFVARDTPGLTVDDRWDPVGMRPTASVGLTLDGAAAEAVLGFPGCLQGVNARHWSTVLFAAVFLGVGEGALREGTAQAPQDGVWARAALAECALSLEAAAGFVESVARDERWPLPAEAQERARRAKTFVARAAVETATRAAMVSGGRCYTPQHPVFRFLCDALAGPLLRPPLPQAMDAVVRQLFPPAGEATLRGAA